MPCSVPSRARTQVTRLVTPESAPANTGRTVAISGLPGEQVRTPRWGRAVPHAGTSASAAQLVRDALELVRVGLLRARRQLERIVVVARDHVDVEVEDGLPGGRPGRVDQVDPVAA